MSEPNEATNGNGFHVKTRWGVLDAKKGSELIAVLCIMLVFAVGWAVYHVSLEVSAAIRMMAQEQRLMSCIISTKQEEREAQWSNPNSYCNRQRERM